MVLPNARPSVDPADNDSLIGLLTFAFKKLLQRTDGMLPAKVIAFDRATNRVQVQPLIMVTDTNNNSTARAQIASLPVLQLGGGGFVVAVNLLPGDLGWIVASDRDISQFLSSYKQARAASDRLHSFSDALFIPDVMTGFTINPADGSDLVIQKNDGSVRVAISGNKVKVTAPTVEITAPTITIVGNVVVTGEVTANGIPLSTHTHGGVESGGSNTSGPNP